MSTKTIEDLVDSNKMINSDELHYLLSKKLNELYEKDKENPLFDYAEIKYSAMIDLIYELMPTLKDDLELKTISLL